MTSIFVQVVETSVATNNLKSSSQDSPDDQLSSRYVAPRYKPFSVVLFIYVKKRSVDLFKLSCTVCVSVNSGAEGPEQLLKRRDGLMSPVSVKALICKHKLHEPTAYIRLKRSDKVDSTMHCQYSVLILSDLVIK